MSSTVNDSQSWNEDSRREALAKFDNATAYSPAPEELEFLKTQTGIIDEVKLKAHVEDVQRRAYAVFPYVCVHRFAFTKPKIGRHFAYPRLLALPRSRSRAIFLEVGCCFGQDIRKAIADGYPAQDAIASDLRQGFWDIGLELFAAAPSLPFVQADLLELDKEALVSTSVAEPPADLASLSSLTPLRGHVAVIYASAVFHLFDFDGQEALARALASLLSIEPGSMIFGMHSGQTVKKVVTGLVGGSGIQHCHGPDSWRELWESVFGEGAVKVESQVEGPPPGVISRVSGSGDKGYHLSWCVTRL
ncbi:hypothetical protein PENSPDRAFT_752895 [Peniophora sp. CONT]|nr:hypothetical protein PENSPDRAFT_752895 [Peniophora sp. CONT]